MEDKSIDPRELRVIAPCLGSRFSGINASLIAVLPEQARHISIATLGFHIAKVFRGSASGSSGDTAGTANTVSGMPDEILICLQAWSCGIYSDSGWSSCSHQ